MDINITSSMTPDQILLQCHNTTAVVPLILSWVAFVLILLITGFLLIDRGNGNHPYKKFFWIWLSTSIITGLIVLLFVVSPFTTQTIISFFTNLFH